MLKVDVSASSPDRPEKKPASDTRYRADIDGLRALAILSVIVFHTGAPWMSGGYIGVDVFFVISGFLISTIIYRDLDAGPFSFREFYERRAKRILPALLTVLTSAYMMAAILLTPRELRSFAAQSFTALTGTSNLFFWRSTGYFEARTELKPLLMTWSLGVEEQFYLLFPALLVVHFKSGLRRHAFQWLVMLSAASLGISIYQTANYPQTAFYLLPSRWWEMGVGTLIAGYRFQYGGSSKINTQSRWMAEVMSVLGVSILLVSLLLLERTTPFPGLAATLPVLATAALILAPASWLNRRILSSRPLVGIGKISYSWYLWHWPLLSFARNSAGGALSLEASVVIVLIAIVLAVASYALIEQPFRKMPSTSTTLWKYAALIVIVGLVSLVIVQTNGLPGRFPEADQIEAAARPSLDNPCLLLEQNSTIPSAPPCVPPDDDDKPVLALMGDSHAASLAQHLFKEAGSRGWSVAQYTKVSCPPTGPVGVFSTTVPSLSHQCPEFYSSADRAVVRNPKIRTVFLTGFWSDFVDPTFPYRHYNPPGEVTTDKISQEKSLGNLRLGLEHVVREFTASGKRVIVAMDVPPVPFDPLLQAVTRNIGPRRFLSGIVNPFGHTDEHFTHVPADNERIVARILRSVALSNGGEFFDLSASLCDRSRCRIQTGGKPLYYDTGHLSPLGAELALKNANVFSGLLAITK